MSVLLKKRVIPIAVWAVCIALAWLLATSRPIPEPRAKMAPKAPALRVMIAQPESHHALVRSQGTVRPKWDISLAAETSGRVVRVSDNFIAGGFFKQGEELLKVETVDYQVALAQAEAQVAQAAQQLAQERGQTRLAEREWSELDNVEANELFLRKPQIAAAEAQLRVATAQLEKANLDLHRTSLIAPFTGRMLEVNIQLGEQVGRSMVLGRAFATDIMEIPLPLTNREVGLVDLPMYADADIEIPVEFTVEVGGQKYQWQGQIVRTEASFDTESRVVYAIAQVQGAYDRRKDGAPPLAPGLFAQAKITGRRFADVIKITRKALYQRTQLLTLNADNHLQITPIEVMQANGDIAMIRGVAAGTAVLLERPKLIINNMKIRPIEASNTGALIEQGQVSYSQIGAANTTPTTPVNQRSAAE